MVVRARVVCVRFCLLVCVVTGWSAVHPGVSSALSGGRAYELVTPVYKAGYGAILSAAALDGERVIYESIGGFNGIPFAVIGNQYAAQRVAGSGWMTNTVAPPFEGSIADFSVGLDLALAILGLGKEEEEIALHDMGLPDFFANWEPFMPPPFDEVLSQEVATDNFNPPIAIGGRSDDLCHLIVSAGRLGGFPQVPLHVNEIYELFRGCGGQAPYLRLVDVSNAIEGDGEYALLNNCGAIVGSRSSVFNAISADGSQVLFTARLGSGCGGGEQLFARLGGSRTIEVSRQPGGCDEVPCPGSEARPGASFVGASEDGSVVYFTTAASLVSGDLDGKNDLYMARIGCTGGEASCEVGERGVTSLVRVSEDAASGQPAEVLGVVDVAPATGVVYFAARGVLTATSNGEGESALRGADNLYGYDPATGRLVFVADLCSASKLSGEREDAHCPQRSNISDEGLWNRGSSQVTDDGRFLVFLTSAQLVRHGLAADTDERRDIYRYDMSSASLERVSVGEEGFDANGNGDFETLLTPGGYSASRGTTPLYSERGMDTRAVSNDGSWIVFTSSEPLSPSVSNGLPNVYAWHETRGRTGEGAVSLISSGSSTAINEPNPVIAASTAPEGRDIFFMTNAGLVREDTESDLDIYDARIGGGFPLAASAPAQCSSDACQGPLTAPAPVLVPASVSERAEGNFSSSKKGKAKPKRRKKHRPRKKGKTRGRSGVVIGGRRGRVATRGGVR
jgi:hypothetical protein